MLHNTVFHAIGLMSGSSLDGLDLCYVRFQHSNSRFEYEIIYADCIEYTNEFRERLRNAPNLSAFEFSKLHTEVGKYFGELTHDFIQKNKIDELDFISSHGQTIFHQPNLGFTSQIGCGAQLAAQTSTKVVCDLRTSDVANKGQGAPIVPVAEQYLFAEYKVFLNIGGIANIAFHKNESVIAYDVCAANTLLNYFAKEKGLDYDKDGNLARSGNINASLLEELNTIAFCKQSAPKSLGTEHVFTDWITLFEKYAISTEDKLATAVEHIAMQVGNAIKSEIINYNSEMLITGGGALNSFLVERIQHHATTIVTVPDVLTIQYKEALAMAFIGLLRILEIPNCLASVTGANKNVIGGAVYLP
jgi:anhydro-N-acetylmuramic acid kinase